jgi:uncharacterized protein
VNVRTTENPNRLAREKSPYLLQHQHNPVDWFPWGEEAFQKARAENKPIFLSIGYSTCHWCHVMERESFENEEIAAFLNDHFVSIKVDREERPDVDRIYMAFVQASGRHGGWPLNVFLAPDLKPFLGGTYWPPEDRQGYPGFPSVLRQIAELWKSRHTDVVQSANGIHAEMKEWSARKPSAASEHEFEGVTDHAAQLFKSAYDVKHGGFGSAPKFPQPSVPLFLLNHGVRNGDKEVIQMVLHTCERMAAGGINDQLAGGFSRYSVDEKWLVPHFEKMLYDNAQLTQLYLDAFLVSREKRYGDVVRATLDYVLREMTDPEGGFYSAEDADSEGHEGKFYCWTLEELEKLLTREEAAVAGRYFGITGGGNFVDHSHPHPLQGQNVLSIADPELTSGEEPMLKSARQKMLAAREKRIRPHRDDKVLVSWNGLMLGAIARAGVVLGKKRYLDAAKRNAAFVRARLWDATTRKLHHRWRDGERDDVQLVEGYACYLLGLLDLYEATLDPEYLFFAVELAESMLAGFFDADQGGFWQSSSADLIVRLKPDYEGAEPSGNSVAAMALLRLGKITGREDFTRAADSTLKLYLPRMRQHPQALPFMLHALAFGEHEPRRAVLTGDPAQVGELLRAVHSVYQPAKVVLGTAGPVDQFASGLEARDEPQVFICTGSECLPPISAPAEVASKLSERG